MPENLKSSPIISEHLKIFKSIRSEVKKKVNSELSFLNPFSNTSFSNPHFSKKNKNDKQILTKWGTSYGSIKDLIQKEKEQFQKHLEEDMEEQKKNIYKRIFEELMVKNFSDFRKDIINECVIERESLGSIDFEKFVIILEFFISLFSGINCKYFIDELGYLNMDFYAYENALMNIAESNRYHVQYRIMNKMILHKYEHETKKTDPEKINVNRRKSSKLSNRNSEKKKASKIDDLKKLEEVKLEYNSDVSERLIGEVENSSNGNDPSNLDDEIEEKNKLKYEEYDEEDVTLFTPFTGFNKHNSVFYRRYDNEDNYHICEECRFLTKTKDVLNLTCSSIFRAIDRTRLVKSSLLSTINYNKIKNPPKDMEWINNVFKSTLLLHDYLEIKKWTHFETLMKTYTYPYESEDVKRINKVFKNKFGEEVGFYFHWITHYISWLIFPSILGTILYFIGYFVNSISGSNAYLSLNLIFAVVVMIWANFYLGSWKSKEEFYNYVWGMDNFKLDKSNEIPDVPVDKNIYMGIKIPVITFYQNFVWKFISYFVIGFCLLFTIIINMLIFYVENANIYADTQLGGDELRTISSGYWLYITPICTFLVREWMSSTYKGIAMNLTNRECHIHKDTYNSSLKVKIIFFEFFNYYFNLYYIAFGKPYFESCPGSSCYDLLGQQLTGILTSSIIIDLTKLFWSAVYVRNQNKKFELNLKENNNNITNSSSKYIYYTRNEYLPNDMSGEFLEVILNYGYIIQFGASSPICFLIALLQTLFMRLSDVINFSKLEYVKLISEAHGIGVMKSVMKILTFLGLITNICIIFFTNSHLVNLEFSKKIMLLIFIENLVIIFVMIFRNPNLPQWFTFKEKINQSFIKKYSYGSQNSRLYEMEKKKTRKNHEESKKNV